MSAFTVTSLCAKCLYGTGKNHRCYNPKKKKQQGNALRLRYCKNYKPLWGPEDEHL